MMSVTPRHHDVRLHAGNNDLPFYVVGGRYADTSFATLLQPDPTEGPFPTYDDAVEVWRASSMRHIDEAFVRYLVVQAASAADAEAHAEEPPSDRAARSA
jgi:hypothetical protein